MLVPLTKVVSTYRWNGSESFGSWPEGGPKRRHHSTQYAVRAQMPISVRSGILALISCSSRFADGRCPSERCALSDGMPVAGSITPDAPPEAARARRSRPRSPSPGSWVGPSVCLCVPTPYRPGRARRCAPAGPVGEALSLASALCFGVTHFASGLVFRRVDGVAVTLYAQLAGNTVALLLALSSPGDAGTAGDYWFGVLSGVGTGVGVAFLYRAAARRPGRRRSEPLRVPSAVAPLTSGALVHADRRGCFLRECPAPREMQGQGARSRQVKNRQVGAARTA